MDYTTWKAQRRRVTSGNQKEEAGPRLATKEAKESPSPLSEERPRAKYRHPFSHLTQEENQPREAQKLLPVRSRSARLSAPEPPPPRGAHWAQLTQQPPAPTSSANRPVVTSLPADSTLCHSIIQPQGRSKPGGSGRAQASPCTHTHTQPRLLINSSWIECSNVKKWNHTIVTK